MGGLNFFRINTAKLWIQKTPKNEPKIVLTDKNLRLSEEKSLKTGGNRGFLRVPLRNFADFRVCAGGARNYMFLSLKCYQRAKQNGGRYLS